MAALDFPDPAVTNPWVDPNGKSWYHDGDMWVCQATGSGVVVQQSKPDEANYVEGTQWFRTSTADIFTLYVDADSRQWVKMGCGSTALIAYPVGAIYMSINDTDPGTIFGGTWAPYAEGRTLVGVGGSYADSGLEGGSETHTLTTDEIPAHTHTQTAHKHMRGIIYSSATASNPGSRLAGSGSQPGVYYANNGSGYSNDSGGTDNATAVNQNTGGGAAHNNMQPYITTYMFVRTA